MPKTAERPPRLDLDLARREFDRWRRRRSRGARIPASLWQVATTAAATHGVSKTSQALHLDYYALQRRLASSESAPSRTAAEFIELSLPSNRESRCQLELCDSTGAAIRIDVTGMCGTELATFIRAVAGHDACCK
jgi:hypothetical protein